MKRKLLTLLSLLLCLVMLIGCGSKEKPAEKAKPAAEEKAAAEPKADDKADDKAKASDLPPLQIGMVTQLTGPNSYGGHEYMYGGELAIEHWGGEVNGRKIELVVADGPTADAVVSEFERLAEDGVQFFVSGYGCIADRAIAHLVDEMGVMYLSNAWDADLMEGHIPNNFFRSGANVNAFGAGTVDAAVGIADQYLGIKAEDLRVALVYTTRYNHILAPLKARCEELGVEIVYDGGYPEDTKDFTPIVTSLMNADYDILIPSQGTNDGAPFQKRMAEMGYKPPLTVASGCYYDTPNFAELGNDITDGNLVLSFTTPSIAESAAPGISKMSADFDAKHGHKPLAHALQGYGVVETYLKVFESLDPADWTPEIVAPAMEEFKADYGELTWYWGIDFDENHDNKKAEQYIINQWQNGECVCIFPDFLATAEGVVPWEK